MPATAQSLTFDQLAAEFKRLGANPSQIDFRPAFSTIATYLASQAQLCFHGEHAPDGTAWAPLAASTIAGRRKGKRKGGTGPKILYSTGMLMKSIVGRGSNHVENMQQASLEWGTNVDYAAPHQFGYSARNLPARPFIGITPAYEETISQIVADHVARLMGGQH